MAKKKGGGGGGANWMDTYGDMVTLLLCFFVLLYSMSTISTDKWKALVQSFNPNAVPNETEIESGNDGPSADPPEDDSQYPPTTEDLSQQDVNDMMEKLFAALSEYSQKDGMENTVSVSMDGGVIYVKLSGQAMFVANKTDLLPGAYEVLGNVCGMLDSAKDAIDKIRVEGHTAQGSSSKPNAPAGDWKLACGRAAEVTIFIQENSSIHPLCLESVGLGQWHPIGNNQSEAEKAVNRRVELAISARDLEQEALKDALSQYTTEDGDGSQAPEASPAPAASQNP